MTGAERYLVAAAIGGMTGYLTLRLGEMGWALGAFLLIGMSVYYAILGRRREIGWMLVAAGAAPGFLLERNGLNAVLDPAVEVGADTWAMLVIAVVVMVVGFLVLLTATWRSSRAPSAPNRGFDR